MQLVNIRVTNCLGLRAGELELGDGVEIQAPNESGKSSLAKALESLRLPGGRELVTVGQAEGEVIAELRDGETEYVVQRRLGRGLKVTSGQGTTRMVVQRPQSWIETVFGPLAFDPLAFSTASPADMRRMLAAAYPTTLDGLLEPELAARNGIDLAAPAIGEIERVVGILEGRRVEIGREAKRRSALAVELQPSEPIMWSEEREQQARDGLAAARARMAGIREAHAAWSNWQQLRDERQQAADAAAAEVERLVRVLDLARARHAELERVLAEMVEPEEPPSDVEAADEVKAAQAAVEDMRRHRELHDQAQRSASAQAEADALQREWDAIQELIRELRGPILSRVLAAGLGDAPVELGDDGTLAVDGIPLQQLPRSRRLRIGVEVAAALQRDSACRIVVVDNAESVTSDRRRELAEMCRKAGMQWVFLVAAAPDEVRSEVTIEKGEIRARS